METPGNHYYGDVSNLNAPYDAISVQGLGAVTWEGKTLPSIGYPWRVASNNTLLFQAKLNQELAKIEKCPLLLDGVLGPRTCGAMLTLEHVPAPDEVVQNCALHASEAMEPKFCPGGIAPEPPQPSEEEELDIQPSKSAGIPIWVWGLGIGALAIGAALMLKKKKR